MGHLLILLTENFNNLKIKTVENNTKQFAQSKFISDFKILVAGEPLEERMKVLHNRVIKALEIHIKSYEIEMETLKDELIVAEGVYHRSLLNNGSFDFDAKKYTSELRTNYDAMAAVSNKLASKKKTIDFLKSRLREVKK